MKLDELISEAQRARAIHGNAEVMIAHGSSGDPHHRASRTFPLLQVSTDEQVILVQSNYCAGYIKKVFPDER